MTSEPGRRLCLCQRWKRIEPGTSCLSACSFWLPATQPLHNYTFGPENNRAGHTQQQIVACRITAKYCVQSPFLLQGGQTFSSFNVSRGQAVTCRDIRKLSQCPPVVWLRIRIQELCRSRCGSVFLIRIRIHISKYRMY